MSWLPSCAYPLMHVYFFLSKLHADAVLSKYAPVYQQNPAGLSGTA